MRKPVPAKPAASAASEEAAKPAPRKRAARAVTIDELDERIIAALREDGRVSNRDLARNLNVNEATIRSRIRRLEESKTMRLVAMVDLGVAGYDFISAVGVQVRGRAAADVARDIAQIPDVLTVIVAIGTQDIEIQVAARDLASLSDTLTNVVANIRGVARLTPGLAMRILKYDSQWVPFS
jgi:Lrp/AsnC family transcriptional regulator, regulator for asnA, asnC and gidA